MPLVTGVIEKCSNDWREMHTKGVDDGSKTHRSIFMRTAGCDLSVATLNMSAVLIDKMDVADC